MVAPQLCSFPLSQETQKRIKEYLEWTPHSTSDRSEIERLLRDVSAPEEARALEDRFLKRLQFGTAGLRGKMGCGFNCMNDLMVIQTTQGLASYILTQFDQKDCRTRGVVLGFDGRHFSERFAHVAAAVFLSKGFRVYLSQRMSATPLVPFAICYLKALAGVQVTASHNPKDDNGYKVYASNGVQIIPPMDTSISSLILENLRPWDDTMGLIDGRGYLDMSKATAMGGSCFDPRNEIDMHRLLREEDCCIEKPLKLEEAYFRCIQQELVGMPLVPSTVKFVYTALHGVGYELVSRLLSKIGVPDSNIAYVEAQKRPDPEFPTVKFPNPEEKGALDLAIELATQEHANVILANDPDADRLACAERLPSGRWKVFTGDELGLLLAALTFELKKKKVASTKDLVFVCSAVSSQMLRKLAQVEQCQFAETMTGFKWIMNRALDLSKPPSVFCFAYEEALGYAISSEIPDKDGVSACAAMVIHASQLYSQGRTLVQQLDSLYKKYGHSVTNNSYFIYKDPEVLRSIFQEFRGDGTYQRKVEKFTIQRIRDVSMRYDDGQPDLKCLLPYTPGSEMITLYFHNGAVITLRTSGTEPKLKWYSELICSDEVAGARELEEVVEATIRCVIQYDKYKHALQRAG